MLYFLYGQDAFRARQCLEEIIKKAKQSSSQLEVRRIDLPKTDFPQLQGQMSTLGLFGGTSLWVLKYPFELASGQLEQLLEFLKRAPESFGAIFYQPRSFTVSQLPKTHKRLYEFLKSRARLEEFKPLKGRQLFNWAHQYAREHQIEIESPALQLLVQNLPAETWAIANELRKLGTYSAGRPVTSQMVRELSLLEVDPVIFDLLDAIGEKRPGAALYYLELALARPEKLLSSAKTAGDEAQKQEHQQVLPFYLVAMLAYALRNLLQVKQLQLQGKTQSELKAQLQLHPFVLQKTSWQARNFELKRLKWLFSRLLDLEANLKKSPAPKPVLLQEFVARAAT